MVKVASVTSNKNIDYNSACIKPIFNKHKDKATK